MGNVTSTSQKITNELLNTMNANCKNSMNINQEISGLKILATDCKNVIIQNSSTSSANCDMSQAAELLAEAYNEASSEQKSQLNLINADNKDQDVEAIIKNKLNTDCDSEQSAIQSIKNSTIDVKNCENMNIINDSNVQTQCVLKTFNQSMNKIDNKGKTKQGGDIQDLVKDVKGHKGEIIFGIIVISLIIMIIAFLLKKHDTPKGPTNIQMVPTTFNSPYSRNVNNLKYIHF